MKQIPTALAAHKALPATTLTDLIQIGPLADGTYRGLTMLDRNVVYAGGVHPITLEPLDQELTFYARTGFDSSAFAAQADTGVDNAEITTLPPVPLFQVEGITQEQVDEGALDKVSFIRYRVNYQALDQGHEIVFSGTIGEVRFKSGAATILETRSISNQLKQSVCELDSLLCRVRRFGSQYGEERFPCLYDVEQEWVLGTVTGVSEIDRVFSTGLAYPDDQFSPGIVEFLTGANAGSRVEIESFIDGDVTLLYPTTRPIVDGDTYRIRRDCTRAHEGHNSCQTFFGEQWVNHFRGEPHMPIGDAAALMTPGVSITASGDVGTGE